MKREKKEEEKRDREISRGNQVNWYKIMKLRGGSGRSLIFTLEDKKE